MGRYHYVFPRWSNTLVAALGLTAMVAPLYVVFVVAYGFSPVTTDTGYQPVQPVPFSHEIHAGRLGLDCRYCHNTVEYAAKAAIPPTQTCFNCHTHIHKDSPQLAPLWESYETGKSVEWIRVHDLPDYAYFNHSAHVTRGVSCVECHGRIDKMETVYLHETLAMGWCLDCHRDPESRVRDPQLVTNLAWGLRLDEATGKWVMDEDLRRDESHRWIEINQLAPSQDCSTCHR